MQLTMLPAGALDWVPPGTTVWVPAVLILIGVAGIVVPVLPGLLLALAGVLLWSYEVGSRLSWAVFGVCAALYLGGVALQWLVPGRRLRGASVGTLTLVLAAVLGVVGFVVVPVVGGPLGFVLGIYLVEHSRSRNAGAAWASTKAALRAVLAGMGVELLTWLAITMVWVLGVVLST